MFLKSITLKNFRGVGDEEKRVEFAPVTLLFGPNNAGKSTIIKALHLAREIFCGENPDYDRIGEFGHGSSLGSFKDYVHNHDLNTEVSLGVEIGGLHGLEIRDLDAYPAGEEIWTPSSLTQPLKRAESAGLEIKIKWDFNKNKAVLGSYGIFINGERLTSIEFDEKDGKIYGEAELFNIKQWIKDDSLKAIEEAAAKADEAGDNREFYKKKLEEEIKKAIPEYFKPFADAGALFPPSPEGGSRYFSAGKREKRKTIVLSPDTLALALWDTRILNKNRAPFSECFDMNDIWGPYYLRGALILFQSFILTPLSLCKRLLENFIYLGPLREIPSRGPREDNKITSAAWSSGIAAWEVLGSVSEDKLDSVNKVLGDEELLNTGYEIRRKRIIELDTEAESFLYEKLKALLDGDFDKNLVAPLKNFLDQPPRVKISLINKKEEIEVQPRDMGTGISQMVPCVVAAAIAEGKDIIAIEQPELHIHPAWQTALADVFIKAIADRPDPPLFILETHSEHFMLRLLRRIRQTTEGDLPDGFPEVAPNMVSVYYIYPGKEGDAEIVGLPIDEEGNFTERWPHGFFEERIKEFM